MALINLTITNFRNFARMQCELSANCNLFYGDNGSGKTSILEAIYYLALGRSFRTHLLRRLARYGATSFTLFGRVEVAGTLSNIGLERSITQSKILKLAGQEIASQLEFTKLLPIQLLNQESYRLLTEGPKMRRQFIDWGLFHVEPSFLELWRNFQRVLEQRNTALRANLRPEYLTMWDAKLVELGLIMHQHRQHYLQKLTKLAQTVFQQLLPSLAIELHYVPGWSLERDLTTQLQESFNTDLRMGYTTLGPQRADLKILIDKVPAGDLLSRGQQKLLLYGLQISQGILLQQTTNKQCIYLLDDLGSELDQHKRQLLAEYLQTMHAQLFITGLSSADLDNFSSFGQVQRFHVEHGMVNAVTS